MTEQIVPTDDVTESGYVSRPTRHRPPLSVAVVEQLTHDIVTERYQPGTALPSAESLCETFRGEQDRHPRGDDEPRREGTRCRPPGLGNDRARPEPVELARSDGPRRALPARRPIGVPRQPDRDPHDARVRHGRQGRSTDHPRRHRNADALVRAARVLASVSRPSTTSPTWSSTTPSTALPATGSVGPSSRASRARRSVRRCTPASRRAPRSRRPTSPTTGSMTPSSLGDADEAATAMREHITASWARRRPRTASESVSVVTP